MVQIGSRVDRCQECESLGVCGEFWNVAPRFRWIVCARCLRRAASGIDQAAARMVVPRQSHEADRIAGTADASKS